MIEPSRHAGDRRALLARATEDALAIRGAVMLEDPDDPRRWCAVCASVQGDLELRVGEPRRPLRWWRPTAAERWLVSNGFTHRVDAWVRPMGPGAPALECAAILEGALDHALGVPPATPLRRRLAHPGVPDGTGAPARDAPYAAHLAVALTGLVRTGHGQAHVECGRPARPLAWAFFDGAALVVEIESAGAPGTERVLGRFPASGGGAAEAAERLSAALERDFGCSGDDPLFVALLDASTG